MSLAHATAWYGLHDLARIDSGDRVLIHSATGGVGQAAIAIARAAGAEIFATAGSEQRRELLRDMGIEHVYDSRSIEFAEQIRRDTDGYGVDIVLNSLTGAAQRAGFELLAHRRTVRRDRQTRHLRRHPAGALPVPPQPHVLRRRPGVDDGQPPRNGSGSCWTRCTGSTADGALPFRESTLLPAGRCGHRDPGDERRRTHRQARARHPAHGQQPRGGAPGAGSGLPRRRRLHHHRRPGWPGAVPRREDGRGRLWAHRADLALAAKSQRRWRRSSSSASIGADVVVRVRRHRRTRHGGAVGGAATATGLPVRGVLHAAAVVEDATLTNITDELIDRDWAPKVYGAWHLHRATASQPLDWFCSFSSAAALVGSPGQGAYAAANSWLDAFTHWRRAQGLPATAIAWGPWAEIGRATALAESGDTAITPDEGAYAFEALLRHDRGYTGYAPVIGTPWLTALAQRSPFAELFRSAGQSRTRHKQIPCRAERAAPGRVAHPAAASGLRAGQPDSASHRRSGPSALRVRPRLAGQPRTAHPHRDRNRDTHQLHGHHHRSAVWRSTCATALAA